MKRLICIVVLCIAAAVLIFGSIFRVSEHRKSGAPKDFSLRFSWWYDEAHKNVIDTQTGSIQKDIGGGTASAGLEPSPELLRQMYELVRQYRLADIGREMSSRELAEDKSRAIAMSPLICYELGVTMNGESFLVRGDQTAVYHMTTSEDAAHFINAVVSLQKMTEALPEWRALPPTDGGRS